VSVAIVGAGPGDPGLITVRGLALVEAADVLVYDRLVAPELVARATAAELIARDELTQRQVNETLVREGGLGRAVVRLKGGDPFVFGRGGEEAAALAEAGVVFEVVPGLSTLTAVPALAGIPLTHRGVSAQVTVVTGTAGDGGELDYARLASTPGTLIVFMGLRRLERIATSLVFHGRPPDEPAAVISRLSLPGACVVVGALGSIAATAAHLESPAVVIVGDVAALDLTARLRGGDRLEGMKVV
jgi:uroporphyrin-III C-methyltransferase